MRKRTDRVLYIMLILMGLITVLCMMFAGVLGVMYVKEKDKNQEAAVKQAQLEEEVVAAFAGDNNALNDEEVQQLVDAKEVEMKAKMKELVQSEDGGAMTMLRYFFPENLVYYDEGGYVFAPILDTLKKHQLVDENFHINDRNEIEYIENGIVTSHKGIDVSKYQGDIDWQAVKADGVEYAFVRLGIRGYGSGKIVLDENFADNMQGANEAGVKAGVYFFTQAVTVEEAQEEANRGLTCTFTTTLKWSPSGLRTRVTPVPNRSIIAPARRFSHRMVTLRTGPLNISNICCIYWFTSNSAYSSAPSRSVSGSSSTLRILSTR